MYITKELRQAREKYESYDPSCWTKAYFDAFSGGFNVYHQNHNFSKKGGGGDAEQEVGKMLARLGKQVEFLPEGETPKPDLKFDNRTWDVKFINKANEETIRTYIKDARKADNAIFYFTTEGQDALLSNAANREIGRFAKMGKLESLPNIYCMDSSGGLSLIWKK